MFVLYWIWQFKRLKFARLNVLLALFLSKKKMIRQCLIDTSWMHQFRETRSGQTGLSVKSHGLVVSLFWASSQLQVGLFIGESSGRFFKMFNGFCVDVLGQPMFVVQHSGRCSGWFRVNSTRCTGKWTRTAAERGKTSKDFRILR